MEDEASNGIIWFNIQFYSGHIRLQDPLKECYRTLSYTIRQNDQRAEDVWHFGPFYDMIPPSVRTMYGAFMRRVGGSFNIAFTKKGDKIKDIEALVSVAKLCGLIGCAQSVFPSLIKILALFRCNYIGQRKLLPPGTRLW